MRRRRERQRTCKIDYSVFAGVNGGLPKGEPLTITRKRKRAATRRLRKSVKEHVFEREGRRCKAFGISPICHGWAIDRHEVVPLGVGGLVTPENCVASCRACHDAAHGEPGVGRRLWYEWSGKAEGVPPNAEEPSQVWAVWRQAA